MPIASYALTGWLIGVERTRAVLALQLWTNGMNIGLDLWFVLGLGWAVPGVALAMLLAEISGLALGPRSPFVQRKKCRAAALA